MSHYFPKLLSFQANFGNFGTRFTKLGLFWCQFKKILKIWPMFRPLYQFLNWIRGHCYTRRLILRPISAARPRIYLCTKNPPPPRIIRMHTSFLTTSRWAKWKIHEAFCKNGTCRISQTSFQIEEGPLINLRGRKGTLSGPHIPVSTFPLSTRPPPQQNPYPASGPCHT